MFVYKQRFEIPETYSSVRGNRRDFEMCRDVE
jgi:hypothetical protein